MRTKNPLLDGWAWLWIAISIAFFTTLPAPFWLELPFAFLAGWHATWFGQKLKMLYTATKITLNKWAAEVEAEKKD